MQQTTATSLFSINSGDWHASMAGTFYSLHPASGQGLAVIALAGSMPL